MKYFEGVRELYLESNSKKKASDANNGPDFETQARTVVSLQIVGRYLQSAGANISLGV
jgi:hypothetical protein